MATAHRLPEPGSVGGVTLDHLDFRSERPPGPLDVASQDTDPVAGGGSGSSRGYYGYRYGPDPWYYRGGYVRDRVHVVGEEDIRDLEAMDSVDLPPSPDPGFDMGFGDMDFGGGDFDF